MLRTLLGRTQLRLDKLNQPQFFSDNELIKYFSIINTWPSKFSLGSSCLKGDADCQRNSAEESWFWVYPMWTRFEGLGAQIDELNVACKRLGVVGIQAFSIDVNWNMGVSWKDIAEFEDSCQARHIRFEMIYWAAQHWRETDEDVDFFNDIHQ